MAAQLLKIGNTYNLKRDYWLCDDLSEITSPKVGDLALAQDSEDSSKAKLYIYSGKKTWAEYTTSSGSSSDGSGPSISEDEIKALISQYAKKDWNENNPSSGSYIENRTHYTEYSNLLELINPAWNGTLEDENAPTIISSLDENDYSYVNSTVKVYKVSDSVIDLSSQIENAIVYFKAKAIISAEEFGLEEDKIIEVENIGTYKEGAKKCLEEYAKILVQCGVVSEEEIAPEVEATLTQISVFDYHEDGKYGFGYGIGPTGQGLPFCNFLRIYFPSEDQENETTTISKGTYATYVESKEFNDNKKTSLSNECVTSLISLNGEVVKQLDSKYIADALAGISIDTSGLEKIENRISNGDEWTDRSDLYPSTLAVSQYTESLLSSHTDTMKEYVQTEIETAIGKVMEANY